MQGLIHFFDQIRPWQRSLMLIGGIMLFWIIEGIVPLFHFQYRKIKHAGINLFFTATTVIVNFAFAYLIVVSSRYATAHHVGLLYVINLPIWAFTITGLLFLDLISAWFIHWLQHKIKWMWKFHIIHHSDTWVDVTTANRHHPGESFFRAAFTLLAVIITGSPMWLLFLYQFLSVLFSQFNHANIHLPKSVDRVIAWCIVSPDMHKVHHHHQQPLTDTNYGNIFSFWDRLFGTYAYVQHPASLTYGIDTHPEPAENNWIQKLLRIPFEPYRPPKGAKFSDDAQKEFGSNKKTN